MQRLIYLAFVSIAGVPMAQAQLGIEAAFARLEGHDVSGATIITHGFSLSDDGGGYMRPLAESIRDEIASQTGEPVWLLDYDVADDGADGQFGASSNFPGLGTAERGHVVLLFDWGPESNEDSRWWAESAGDALFALGTGLGLHDPRQQASVPVQFIGHSFGTVVTTEAVERLAGYSVPVDQVTLIDPHDFDQSDVPTFDEAQDMSALGAPVGYGATIWNNVQQADVYYQTRGNQEFFVSLTTADPEGRPISGAYNQLLDGSSELPSGNPYSLGSFDSDHGYAWNTFYQSTVQGSLVAGGIAPADNNLDFTQTGWAYSIHNANRIVQPTNNFYDGNQDHEHSSSDLVTPSGAPNASGLSSLGLTSQQIVDGRFDPEFAPGDIVNGDLNSGDRTSAAVDIVAGWSHHGGGGDSEINSEGGNRFLLLDGDDVSRQHNYNYVPINAYELVYRFRVADASSDDVLEIKIADQLVGTESLTTISGWQERRIPIPVSRRDSVATFGFELVFGDTFFNSPVVHFDDFRYEIADPVIDANVPLGGTIDLGSLFLGESFELVDGLAIANSGHVESVLDLLGASLSDPLWEVSDFDALVSLSSGEQVLIDILFAGSEIAGVFSTALEIPTSAGLATWTLLATVENQYAGDFNGDGVVDAADYTVWRDLQGSGSAIADADRSGAVDQADYLIWRSQFGLQSPSLAVGPQSVPEPTTICLAAGLLSVVWLRISVSRG